MRSSKLNQGSKLDDIVNKRNKWLFSGTEISSYLVESNNSLLIPLGKKWYSPLAIYPSYVFNFLKLLYFLMKQLCVDKTSFQNESAHILFSSGEGYDLKNYSKVFLNNNVEVIHLEAFNTNQKINFNIVKIKSVFLFFLENIREANSLFKLKLPLYLRKTIVSHSLPEIGIYTYLCAFLSAIKEQIPNVKIFHNGARVLSIAATRIGIETVYLSHGLIRKQGKAGLPFYNNIYVYSSEEKTYYEDISPNSNVCMYPVKELPKLKKRVIIFLRQDDDDLIEETLSEILTLFLKKGYKIFLKKHPANTGVLADETADKYNLELTDTEMDASEIILNLRPSFTVGATTTALCESLNHGVIPISISDERIWCDRDDLTWSVYPIKKRSLSWGEEKERIFELLEDTSLYKKTLSELRMR